MKKVAKMKMAKLMCLMTAVFILAGTVLTGCGSNADSAKTTGAASDTVKSTAGSRYYSFHAIEHHGPDRFMAWNQSELSPLGCVERNWVVRPQSLGGAAKRSHTAIRRQLQAEFRCCCTQIRLHIRNLQFHRFGLDLVRHSGIRHIAAGFRAVIRRALACSKCCANRWLSASS
mgnify:CR=1 FL=1